MFTDKNVHERDQKQINKHIIKKIHMVLLFDFIVPMAYFFKNCTHQCTEVRGGMECTLI